MSDQIDLGMKYPKPTSPENPGEQVHFPSLYVDSDEDLSQLPDEGTMTIAFSVRSRSKTETQDGARHSITIDVTKILDFQADEGAESNGNAGDDREANLDKMAEEEMESQKSKKDLEQD